MWKLTALQVQFKKLKRYHQRKRYKCHTDKFYSGPPPTNWRSKWTLQSGFWGAFHFVEIKWSVSAGIENLYDKIWSSWYWDSKQLGFIAQLARIKKMARITSDAQKMHHAWMVNMRMLMLIRIIQAKIKLGVLHGVQLSCVTGSEKLFV